MEVIFEGGGSHVFIDDGGEDAPVGVIVDFPAVHFGDEGAEHFPWDFGRGDVGAALGDGVNPCVDDEAAAFILE